MAAPIKPKAVKRPSAPAGRASKWEDLDTQGQKAVSENMGEMGNVKTRHGAAISAAREAQNKPGANPMYVEKQGHRAASLAAIQPYLQDKPITMGGATQERVNRVGQGVQRAKAEGKATVRGAGWYFGHHADIAASADKHGFDHDVAITATTALSPMNDPETEKKAGHAVMDMVANQRKHKVLMTPELHAAASKRLGKLKGPPIPEHMIGKNVSLHRLDSTHIGAIGSVAAGMRDKGQPVQSTADFTSVSATRLSREVAQAVRVLRGETDHRTAIDPHSSPKVWSYREATLAAKPRTPEHTEYMRRMTNVTQGKNVPIVGPEHVLPSLRPHMKGGSDITGLAHSERGILSSQHHTAEDTWMQSISTGQTPKNTRDLMPGVKGRGVSIAKLAGSDPKLAGADAMRKDAPSGAKVASDPKFTSTGLSHAFNNRATRHAAAAIHVPNAPGMPSSPMPAVGVQETAWTEQRIQAHKDPIYEKEQRGLVGKQFGSR